MASGRVRSRSCRDRYRGRASHRTEGQDLSVGQRLDGELGLRALAVGDDRAGRGGQLEVPGEEVGVEVGLDDPLDVEAELVGLCEVAGDVALRVDDHGPSGALVGDQVAEQ